MIFFFFIRRFLLLLTTSEKDSIHDLFNRRDSNTTLVQTIDEFGVESVEMGHIFKMSYPSPYGHVQETLVKLQLSSTTIC